MSPFAPYNLFPCFLADTCPPPSAVPEPGKPRETAYVKTSAMLLSGSAGVAVLAFRGTEPLENVGWLTDFDVVPPEQDPVGWTYGKYHSGFRRALGLDHHLQGDPSVQCGYDDKLINDRLFVTSKKPDTTDRSSLRHIIRPV